MSANGARGWIMFVLAALVATVVGVDGGPREASAQAGVLRKPVQEMVEALGRAALGDGGRRAAQELASMGGEATVRRIVERTLREGGEDAVHNLVRLTRAHGPDTLRAADNAVSIPRLAQALGSLPDSAVGPALRRLGAGAEGRALARLADQHGASVLRAEVAHPGIGGRMVGALGVDTAAMIGRLPSDQAMHLARHAEDIARLPASQKEGVLRILHQDAGNMIRFMGRFAEQNPGKVLFTGAATTIILANSERILGGEEIFIDSDGLPIPVTRQGLPERIINPMLEQVLRTILPILALGLAIWLGIKLWFAWRLHRLRLEAARPKGEQPAERMKPTKA